MYFAQELLTRIHEINIPSLYEDNIDQRTRLQHIAKTKQKLKDIKLNIDDHKRLIEAGKVDEKHPDKPEYDKVGSKPYLCLEALLTKLIASLSELEVALQSNREFPIPPRFGDIFYGNPKQGYRIIFRFEYETIQEDQSQGDYNEYEIPVYNLESNHKIQFSNTNKINVQELLKKHDSHRGKTSYATKQNKPSIIPLIGITVILISTLIALGIWLYYTQAAVHVPLPTLLSVPKDPTIYPTTTFYAYSPK